MGGSSMKTKLTIAIVAWVVGFVLTVAYACPKGSSEWRDGVCVADIRPQTGPSVKPSDEVAPGKGHQPDWQTGEAKTVDAPSMVKHDEEQDAEIKKEMDSVGKPVSTHTFTLKGAK